jgi:hypothetical protein
MSQDGSTAPQRNAHLLRLSGNIFRTIDTRFEIPIKSETLTNLAL